MSCVRRVLVMDDIALAIVERFGMLEDPRT